MESIGRNCYLPLGQVCVTTQRAICGSLRTMGTIDRLFSCLVLLFAFAVVPVLPARAAETCPFITAQQLAGAMPALKWSLISNQDGRGCIYQGGRGDTMMLTVFRNPDKDRARELYATFVKTLGERMPLKSVAGTGDEGQGGATAAGAERQEASVVTLTGDTIVQIRVYPIGRRADDALLGPLTEVARVAITNVGRSSERFGDCEWLAAADADGFLDKSTLTVQRTGAGSCMMFDREANTMTVAVITMSQRHGHQHDEARRSLHTWRSPNSAVKPSASIPAQARATATPSTSLSGRKANRLRSCSRRSSRIQKSGSVERLKAVATRVYGKL